MRLLPLSILLVIGLFVSAAAAQTSDRFEGRLVHERTGAPVRDASVFIIGQSGSARTDADGRFVWAPAPRGPFPLIVVLSGGQVARPVIVDGRGEGTTSIPVAALTDEAVTVLGAAPSINAPPGSARTMLAGADIARRSPENVMKALETMPGISQVSEGHAAVPAVRGLARGRTLLLIDGGRVTSERRVGPSGTFLDPSIVEGIDVARGPGSVAYGSDALGGVVSIRTRRAEPGSPLRARLTGTIGAGVPEERGSFEASKGFQHGGVLVQAHVRNADDYDSPEGEVFNSGWEDQGFFAHVTHSVGRGLLSTTWQSDLGRDFGRPRNNSRTVRFFYPFEDSHRFTASYQAPDVAGFRQMTFSGFWGAYDQRTDQDRFPTATTGRSIERADVSANDFHVTWKAERLMRLARVEVGVDVNGRYNLHALDTVQAFALDGALTRETINESVVDARRIDAGLYVQAETGLGNLTRVSAGVRVDRVTTTNIGGFFGNRSTSNAASSGFGAVTVGPFQGFSFTAQVSRGFRDPTVSDRYFRGPSGRGAITGNPDLKPETSLQFDMAARYTTRRTQLALYVYQYGMDDMIERYQTQTDLFFFRNRDRARLRGVEVEARMEVGMGSSIEVAAHLARGRALDDRANLDDISPPTLSVLGRKDFGDRVYSQMRVALYGKADRPGPSEVVAPRATLVDVGAGWRLLPQLELRGLLRNALDDDYYASPDPRWVLAPGRSASLTAVVQF